MLRVHLFTGDFQHNSIVKKLTNVLLTITKIHKNLFYERSKSQSEAIADCVTLCTCYFYDFNIYLSCIAIIVHVCCLARQIMALENERDNNWFIDRGWL